MEDDVRRPRSQKAEAPRDPDFLLTDYPAVTRRPGDLDQECEDAFFADLEEKLASGAQGRGAKLSANECAALLKNRTRPTLKRPRGRPVAGWDKSAWMAVYCFRLETSTSVKAAVAQTARVYGVSRATVFAARKKIIESK